MNPTNPTNLIQIYKSRKKNYNNKYTFNKIDPVWLDWLDLNNKIFYCYFK